MGVIGGHHLHMQRAAPPFSIRTGQVKSACEHVPVLNDVGNRADVAMFDFRARPDIGCSKGLTSLRSAASFKISMCDFVPRRATCRIKNGAAFGVNARR